MSNSAGDNQIAFSCHFLAEKASEMPHVPSHVLTNGACSSPFGVCWSHPQPQAANRHNQFSPPPILEPTFYRVAVARQKKIKSSGRKLVNSVCFLSLKAGVLPLCELGAGRETLFCSCRLMIVFHYIYVAQFPRVGFNNPCTCLLVARGFLQESLHGPRASPQNP